MGVLTYTSMNGSLPGDVQGANSVAVLAVGADEAGHGDDAAVGEQFRDLADAANVLLAVGRGEAQVLVEAVADVVAVEDVGQPAALDQGVFEGERDGALAGSAQAGKPQCRALLSEQLLRAPRG